MSTLFEIYFPKTGITEITFNVVLELACFKYAYLARTVLPLATYVLMVVNSITLRFIILRVAALAVGTNLRC